MSVIGFLVSVDILAPGNVGNSVLLGGMGVNILINEEFWPGRIVKTESGGLKIDLSIMEWGGGAEPHIGDIIGIYIGPENLVARASINTVCHLKAR